MMIMYFRSEKQMLNVKVMTLQLSRTDFVFTLHFKRLNVLQKMGFQHIFLIYGLFIHSIKKRLLKRF